MSLPRKIVGVAFLAVIAFAGTAASRTVPHADREVARIHAHFDSVLIELQARDVTTLSAVQRARRAELVTTLRAYNARAIFPHNYDFAQPTPYFIDRKTGTLCAVAHLMESTGRRDLVDRIAGANNNVWVAELAGDSAVATWLDAQGITLAEAARIQVPYIVGEEPNQAVQQAKIVSYVAGAPLALAGSLVSGIWNSTGNADGHRKSVIIVGIASGIATSALGGMLIREDGAPRGIRNVGGAGMAIGAISTALAIRSISHRGRFLAERDAKVDARRADPDAEIVPMLNMGKNASAGLAMTVRF